MNDTNWASRKLMITGICLFIISGIPILYKHLGISDQIAMLVVGSIVTAGGSYNAFNTLAKKYGGDDDKPAS